MDISVIILSWNTKELLHKCLKALQHHKSKFCFEVIVVDNCSSDGSADMVRSCFPFVVLIESGENLGFAKGNNLGLNYSSGRFKCLMNSDVEILDGAFDSIIRFMDEYPRVGI